LEKGYGIVDGRRAPVKMETGSASLCLLDTAFIFLLETAKKDYAIEIQRKLDAMPPREPSPLPIPRRQQQDIIDRREQSPSPLPRRERLEEPYSRGRRYEEAFPREPYHESKYARDLSPRRAIPYPPREISPRRACPAPYTRDAMPVYLPRDSILPYRRPSHSDYDRREILPSGSRYQHDLRIETERYRRYDDHPSTMPHYPLSAALYDRGEYRRNGRDDISRERVTRYSQDYLPPSNAGRYDQPRGMARSPQDYSPRAYAPPLRDARLIPSEPDSSREYKSRSTRDLSPSIPSAQDYSRRLRDVDDRHRGGRI
jgi:hypothetical protein